MKQDEIKKLEDTHNSLTKDALKQAQSGASMKKVQHNLKIAKSVRKRVEDLKQQVQSDQLQLQNVKNQEEIAQAMPFKKDQPKDAHVNVQHIPSVQDSSTGTRHTGEVLGTFLATGQQNMMVAKSTKKAHGKAYHDQLEIAEKQILEAEGDMKKVTQDVTQFQTKINLSLAQMMQKFNSGVKALEQAKQEDAEESAASKQDSKQEKNLS